METVRLPIPSNACAKARELIAGGLDPATPLEFMRGDIVSLRGTALAFASRTLDVSHEGTPIHRRLRPRERTVLASLVVKIGYP